MILLLLMIIFILSISIVFIPTTKLLSSGTTNGIPKECRTWSIADFMKLRYYYAKTLNLTLDEILNSMYIMIDPSKASDKDGFEWSNNIISTRTGYFSRYKHYIHSPTTEIVDSINVNKPYSIISCATFTLQLTRLLERGKLTWKPTVLVLVAEYIDKEEWFRMQKSWFPTRIEQLYGATECPIIGKRNKKTGLYEPVNGSKFYECEEGIQVYGFPEYKWIKLTDQINIIGDGFDIIDTRLVDKHKFIKIGLQLQEDNILDCFQIQRLTETEYKVAFVGDSSKSGQIQKVFSNILPTNTTIKAVHGESEFKHHPRYVVKGAGFLDLRS